MILDDQVKDFFNRYASSMNNALFGEGSVDVAPFLKSFSCYVVGASPAGVAGGKNDEEFKKSIESGIEYYRRVGIISMNIVAKEIAVFDEMHAMAKIKWESIYDNLDSTGGIVFDVIYLVQARDQTIKIFAYVTGDEQKALRDHGLIA
jgi:hypothetical protein